MKYVNIPIFVPHIGCPYNCVFCNQNKITEIDHELKNSEIEDIIEKYLETVERENTFVEVAFFGGSFTGISSKKQENYLEIANKYLKEGLIDGIRISTRPDYINDKILERMSKYGVTTIEIGVQSLNENVINLSKRGHSIEAVIKAVELIKAYKFSLGIQIMIGLPGDNKEITIETTKKVVKLKPDFVRVYPTLVIKNTELGEMYFSGAYKPLNLDKAIEITAEVLKIFYSEKIKVIRVGLQPTETLLNNIDVIAGPFHPSFKYLVESRMFKDSLDENIGKYKNKEITIEINDKDISNFMGHKKENIKFINEKYNINNINIVKTDKIKRMNYNIIDNNITNKYCIY